MESTESIKNYIFSYAYALFLGVWLGLTQEDLFSNESLILMIGINTLVMLRDFRTYKSGQHE